MNLKAWIDGACEPNPGGIAAYGVIIKTEGGHEWRRSGIEGEGEKMSNNVAEYKALIVLLEMFRDGYRTVSHITVHSDSEMLVGQMNADKGSKRGLYMPYLSEALRLARVVGRKRLSFVHVPRGQNMEADALAKAAIRRYRDDSRTS